MNGPGYVYVMIEVGTASCGPCKIGVAAKPAHRLSGHQVSNYREVAFVHVENLATGVDALRVEDKAHRSLHDKLIRGEWYDVSAFVATRAVKRAHRVERGIESDDDRLAAYSEGLMASHPLALATGFVV